MLKIIIPIILLLAITGCSDKTVYAPNEKIYAQEDLDIFLGIELARAGELSKAIKHFERLYNKTQRFDYLVELIKLQVEAKQLTQARQNIATIKNPDIELKRLLVLTYIKEEDYDTALKLAIQNTKQSNSNVDYRLVADIYLTIKDYENAYRYLQSAYAKDQSIQNLLPMVRIMVSYLGKDSDAIAYLQTYINTHGFNEYVYEQILSIHSKNENVAGMKGALTSLYKNTEKEDYANNLLSVFGYMNDTQGAIEFLKSSKFNPKLLFDLYKETKEYNKALNLAQSEYSHTKDPEWLANIAVLKYELSYSLAVVVEDFEKALKAGLDKAVYLNYYGYLLIDHEIDIRYGIDLVKKALQINPQSVFYIDSLAWGYYKLKECSKAQELLPYLQEEDSKEIQEHVEKIKRCKE